MLPEVQEVHARGKTQRVFVRPFAWNLHAPTHMEWSPDGRLFVVERTTGKIKDATKGGDLADAPAVIASRMLWVNPEVSSDEGGTSRINQRGDQSAHPGGREGDHRAGA